MKVDVQYVSSLVIKQYMVYTEANMLPKDKDQREINAGCIEKLSI